MIKSLSSEMWITVSAMMLVLIFINDDNLMIASILELGIILNLLKIRRKYKNRITNFAIVINTLLFIYTASKFITMLTLFKISFYVSLILLILDHTICKRSFSYDYTQVKWFTISIYLLILIPFNLFYMGFPVLGNITTCIICASLYLDRKKHKGAPLMVLLTDICVMMYYNYFV